MFHHRQIVCNKQVSQAKFSLKLDKKVETIITSGMSAHVAFCDLKAYRCPSKLCQYYFILSQISFDVSFCSADMDGPPTLSCKGCHLEIYRNSIFKFHVDDLMIDYIVIACINASAVRSGFKRFPYCRLRKVIRCQHTTRPGCISGLSFPDYSPDSCAFICNINLLCIIRTVSFRQASVQASLCSALRCLFRPEEIQPSIRRNFFALFPKEPDKNIQIMTALCKNHRTRLVCPSPVPSHITVSLMPVGNLLHRLN